MAEQVKDFLGTAAPSSASRLLAASRGAFLDLLPPAADAEERFRRADPVQLLSLARERLGHLAPRPERLPAPSFALIHGQGDLNVPPTQSRAFHQRWLELYPDATNGCRLVEVPGEGHFEHLRRDSRVWSAVVELLESLG